MNALTVEVKQGDTLVKVAATTLNPNSAIFREVRADIRSKNKNLSGLDLAGYLYNYAADGKEYVKTLKKIIKQNDLTDFNNSVLMSSGSSKSLTL